MWEVVKRISGGRVFMKLGASGERQCGGNSKKEATKLLTVSDFTQYIYM
jgi:hypothetical protein